LKGFDGVTVQEMIKDAKLVMGMTATRNSACVMFGLGEFLPNIKGYFFSPAPLKKETAGYDAGNQGHKSGRCPRMAAADKKLLTEMLMISAVSCGYSGSSESISPCYYSVETRCG